MSRKKKSDYTNSFALFCGLTLLSLMAVVSGGIAWIFNLTLEELVLGGLCLLVMGVIGVFLSTFTDIDNNNSAT